MKISGTDKQRGNLPDFVTIGALKCGTTSLHYYLGLHPDIMMSREKELNFFFVEKGNWHRGIDWYRSHFTERSALHGETSPRYTYYPMYQGIAGRMYEIIPGAKLIYILRDPLKQIISNYIQNYSDGREQRSFPDALGNSTVDNSYLSCCSYYMQLEQYFPYYPDNRILVITLEDLFRDRRGTLSRVFRFLGVDDTFYTPKFLSVKHTSDTKRQKNRIGMLLKRMAESAPAKIVPPEIRLHIGRVLYPPFSKKIETPRLEGKLRRKVIEYLADDIKKLREYTGCRFEEWSI